MSLDIENPAALTAYLRETGRIAPAESPAIQVLAGGVSNKTVLVTRPGGEAWVLKQALPKLRVAVDWFSDPARIVREALGIRYLSELAPAGAITPLVFEDRGKFLLAMRAVPRPHENWKTMLLAGDVRNEHAEEFGRLLGTVHAASYARAAELQPIFADRTFFETLRVEPYYEYTASRVPESREFYDGLIASTRARTLCIVHGDYSPKNVLIHQNRLVLLDHEVIHWGDPAFDLGFALAHFMSKANHLPELRGAMLDAGAVFVAAYAQRVGGRTALSVDLAPMMVRQTLGCLLARVAGRSPLEYLSEDQRAAQKLAALALMRDPPKLPMRMLVEYAKLI